MDGLFRLRRSGEHLDPLLAQQGLGAGKKPRPIDQTSTAFPTV